jgi:outer membrane protein
MRKFFFIAICVLAASAAGAQRQWTLRQCIDYAVENNVEIRQTALDVERAEVELNTTQNSRLPSLSADAGQSLSFGRNSFDIQDPAYPDDPSKEITVIQNVQTYNISPSISTSMPVFHGFRIRNQVKAGRLDVQAATEGLERVKQNVELGVTGYYLDVLFKKEILTVGRQQTALVRKQVENTAKMVEEGKVARSQLYEIQAQLADSEMNEVNAANDLALALLNLSQALNLEYSPDFDVAGIDSGELASDAYGALRSPDVIYDMAVGTRPVVREAELRLQSSELGVKIAQSALMPSLDLSAGVSTSYQHLFGQVNKGFGEQIRNRFGQGVSLGLRIPIFNRNATRNNVRLARLGVQNQTLALEGVKLALYKEIQQAHQRAVAAGARRDAAERALAASEEAFRAMELRYESGKATVYEYSDAQTKLLSSRSSQLQARYDRLFSIKILDFYSGRAIDL